MLFIINSGPSNYKMYKLFSRHLNYLTLIALAGLMSMSACGELSQKNRQKVNKALSDSLTSITQTRNLAMNLIEGGIKKVRLRGKYAKTYSTNKINETRISGPVSIEVYDSTQTIKTWASSDSAVYYANTSEFKLFGNVIIRTRSKKYLYSEYIDWDQTDRKISTPRFVTIITPSDSIAGTGFSGTTDLSSYSIKNPSGKVTF
jgi:LPS export ABC transporter protein LptC